MAIMLVEPDQNRREAAHIFLINMGATVTALPDAETALHCIRAGGYNLLITSDEGLGATCRDEKLLEHIMADQRPVFLDSFAEIGPPNIKEIITNILRETGNTGL